MLFKMRQWFFSGKKNNGAKSAQLPSKNRTYTKLPKSMWDLDEGYKDLMRELAKR